MPRKRDARFPELNLTSATEDPQSKAGTQKPVTGEQTYTKTYTESHVINPPLRTGSLGRALMLLNNILALHYSSSYLVTEAEGILEPRSHGQPRHQAETTHLKQTKLF